MGEIVRESVACLEGAGKVVMTPAGPVIPNALICGLTSVHGYDYDPACWANGRAREIYEGAESYADHAVEGAPSVFTKLGWWENVRTDEIGRPRGDYHLCPEHPLTARVVWAREHKPDFYSFSHVCEINKTLRNGRVVVTSITGKAKSIDLVYKGGTTAGIHEHAHQGGRMATVREYAAALVKRPAATVEQVLKLKQLVREDEYGGAAMVADAPPADGDGDVEAGITASFLSAAQAVMKKCMETKDKASVKACLSKLKGMLNAHADIVSDADGDGQQDGEEEAEAAEQDEAKESAAAKAPAKPDAAAVWAECVAESFTPTPTQQTMLLGTADAATRASFIRECKRLNGAEQPRSGSARAGGDVAREDASMPAADAGGLPSGPEYLKWVREVIAARNGTPARN